MRRFRHVFWLVWIGVIASPLVFLRLALDPASGAWRVEFRSDRWLGLWRGAPVWFWQHAGELLAVAVIVAGLVLLARLWRLPAWGRFRNSIGEKTRHPSRPYVVGLVVIALLILASRYLGNTQLEWAVMSCLYVVLAMGLNLTVGMTGLLVLGYAGFVAVGAYTFAVMHQAFDVSLWAAIVPAALFGAMLGCLLGLPSIRLRGDYLAIVTLGFGETVRFLIKNFVGEQSIVIARDARVPALLSDNPVWRAVFPDGLSRLRTELWVTAGFVALSMWLMRNLACSRIGRAWIAIRENEAAASAMGIPTVRMKLLAFTLSAAWAAVTGVLFVAHNTSANPEMFGFGESVLIVSMVVLGGMGSGPGPVIGALVLYLLPEVLRERFPALLSYRPMIVGGLMVAMMIYRPQGLLGSLRERIELGGEEDEATTS
jgi:branched-chain amino acid transport system permease protein